MATEKDYYTILGVAKSATLEEIKTAFRKLAMQYHPDRNPGDKVAEERFKEAAEAYEVLSNPEKRKMYDQFGHAAFSQGQGGGGGYRGFNMDEVFNGEDIFGGFNDIFESFFGGGGGRKRQSGPRRVRGSDIRADISLNLVDVLQDKTIKLKVRRNEQCDSCGGTGSRSSKPPKTCPTCGGTGSVRTMQGFFSISTPCPNCNGIGTVIDDPCSKCRGTGVTERDELISIRIPAGVEDGMKVRISGEGDIGRNGGSRGDLYVLINIKNNTGFERQSNNLLGKLRISYPRAIFGGDVEVETLESKKRVSIPAGVQVGHQIRLRGEGIPDVHTHQRGDIYYEVTIDIPRNLNAQAKKMMKEYAEILGEKM